MNIQQAHLPKGNALSLPKGWEIKLHYNLTKRNFDLALTAFVQPKVSLN